MAPLINGMPLDKHTAARKTILNDLQLSFNILFLNLPSLFCVLEAV